MRNKNEILPEYRHPKVGSSESHTTSPAARIISLVPNTDCIILKNIKSKKPFSYLPILGKASSLKSLFTF